jgi:uncharacterized protein DUF2760
MNERPRRSATLILIIISAGIVFAVGNLAMLTWSVHGSVEMPLLVEFSRACAPCVAYFVVAPLVVSILVAIMVQRLVASTRTTGGGTSADEAPATDPSAPALRLLALLQQDGRLIDFLQEDIDAYEDAQVGAAVRSIHAGCRKTLHEHLSLDRIYAADEGSPITVEKGFDPNAVRLSGNVTGQPPFTGTLQHGGWRVTKVSLPDATTDPAIVAPAEVEIS